MRTFEIITSNHLCPKFRNKEKSDRVRTKLLSGYVTTPEQKKSMHHRELGTMCKCGHKETKVNCFLK